VSTVAHTSGGRQEGVTTQLEDFLALVAHEVRTPLAVVKGAVATMGALGPDDHKVRAQMLAMIDRNVNLAVLLMDRMSLARAVEEGTVRLDTRRLDLVRLVRLSVHDLQQVILGDHTTRVAAIDALEVIADPTALQEIVFNVLSNAAKYSAPQAPIEVTVDRRGDLASVEVRNHGGGVAPGDTERIFGKYFQGDGASSGVGLGLFVSRGLARAHGGDLRVRPAARSGSEFVLELPLEA
jgi:signal transduction histidine kinase